jgi:hypothetical protein
MNRDYEIIWQRISIGIPRECLVKKFYHIHLADFYLNTARISVFRRPGGTQSANSIYNEQPCGKPRFPPLLFMRKAGQAAGISSSREAG